jgi:hypothetical protein
MGQGYKAVPRGDISPIVDAIGDVAKRTGKLETPTGTSLANLVAKVEAALVNLIANVNSLVNDAIAANSYTQAQINSLVANPGNIAPVDVTASGRVYSAGAVVSPGSKATTVTVGYSAVYIDGTGVMGGNTSSRRFKQDITPVQTNYAGFLGLTVYKFRYIEAVEQLGDDAAWEYGLIAEEAVEVVPWACFYEADGVTVRGINYDRLVVALLNAAQDHEARITAQQAQIDALLAYTGLDSNS